MIPERCICASPAFLNPPDSLAPIHVARSSRVLILCAWAGGCLLEELAKQCSLWPHVSDPERLQNYSPDYRNRCNLTPRAAKSGREPHVSTCSLVSPLHLRQPVPKTLLELLTSILEPMTQQLFQKRKCRNHEKPFRNQDEMKKSQANP